jgi:PAS domain S-box-containing protein
MMDKIGTHAGRPVLLGLGILLTSTVGHAAARLMAEHMAARTPSFSFQLAVMIVVLLLAVPVAAFFSRRHPAPALVRVAGAPDPEHQVMMTQSVRPTQSGLSAPQLMQMRLPPGTRLDSTEAVVITTDDASRRILHVNPAFVRMTGFSASDWIGRSGDLLVADGPLRMESLLWLDTEPDGREAHWIARLHRRDGVQFCAEAHLHSMPGRDVGGLPYVVMVMTDVTSRVGAGKARERGAGAEGGADAAKSA